MTRNSATFAVGILLFIIFGLLLFTFQVRQTEVVVVTTFGKPSRNVTQPGAYLKWPWPIQKVNRFDRRAHSFESKYEETFTSDSFNLLVMTYAGWSISDPSVFFPKFGADPAAAERALEGMVRSAQNAVIGNHSFSHFISTDPTQLKFTDIEGEMLKIVQAQCRANNYGIDVSFLGIKRLGLPESVVESVFETMRSERTRLAKRIESEGAADASRIRAQADSEAAKILAEADARATGIRSQGEAEALKYYQVFEQSPELAKFLQTWNALEAILKERATVILDPNTPPWNLLQELPGKVKEGSK